MNAQERIIIGSWDDQPIGSVQVGTWHALGGQRKYSYVVLRPATHEEWMARGRAAGRDIPDDHERATLYYEVEIKAELWAAPDQCAVRKAKICGYLDIDELNPDQNSRGFWGDALLLCDDDGMGFGLRRSDLMALIGKCVEVTIEEARAHDKRLWPLSIKVDPAAAERARCAKILADYADASAYDPEEHDDLMEVVARIREGK